MKTHKSIIFYEISQMYPTHFENAETHANYMKYQHFRCPTHDENAQTHKINDIEIFSKLNTRMNAQS